MLADEAFSAFTTARCRLEFDRATAMLAVQGGLMGTGWTDVFRQTFGRLFCKRSLVASGYGNCSRPRNVDRRPYATAEYASLLFMLTTAQFILLAGVGHAR